MLLAGMAASSPLAQTSVASDIDIHLRKVQQKRQGETRALKRQLQKKHGDKTWYIVRYEQYEPQISRSYVQIVEGHRVQDIATTTIHSQAQVRTLKLHGADIAAETLWQLVHDPTIGRFEYRVFKHEDAVNLFLAEFVKAY
jgi:hypothetical protein